MGRQEIGKILVKLYFRMESKDLGEQEPKGWEGYYKKNRCGVRL